MKRKIVAVFAVALIGVIVIDSAFHFDRDLVHRKIENFSDQRNWSFFYGQEHVYDSAGLRYKADLDELKSIIRSKSLVLSDLATSYHIAAQLPVYVLNVHSHQQSSGRWQWIEFIEKRYFCYQEFEENRERVSNFLSTQSDVDYLIVNKDQHFWHRKRDCLAFRGHVYSKELSKLATLEYQGDYLDLYKFK